MARDPLLRDAVRAIKQKIESAADQATPEELAYLGTAIDRIGGRATVLEVEEMGDIKMEEISEHAQTVEAETIAAITTTKDTAIATINATKQAAETAITNTKTTAEASITATKNAAITAMQQTETSAVANVNSAAQTAIQQAAIARDQAINVAQAAANSVTQQLVLGRKTFFFAQL